MSRIRMIAVASALVMSLGAGATVSAAPGASTFHGTLSTGYWWPSGESMAVAGEWNLNVDFARDAGGSATGVFLVRIPGGGRHAIWTPANVDLQPLTAESPARMIVPDLVGVVNDPAHGTYAYTGRGPNLDTVIAVYESVSGEFFYADVSGPTADGVWGPDGIQVVGTGGRPAEPEVP